GLPQVIALTGMGGTPIVKLGASNLNFGYHLVGTSSLSQTVTLTNTGDVSLAISSVTPSTGFNQTNNCGTALAPNGSCTITATFSPTAAGPVSGTITIIDNAGSGSQTITLSGIGALTPIVVSPSNVSFGNQAVGTTSAAQPVLL